MANIMNHKSSLHHKHRFTVVHPFLVASLILVYLSKTSNGRPPLVSAPTPRNTNNVSNDTVIRKKSTFSELQSTINSSIFSRINARNLTNDWHPPSDIHDDETFHVDISTIGPRTRRQIKQHQNNDDDDPNSQQRHADYSTNVDDNRTMYTTNNNAIATTLSPLLSNLTYDEQVTLFYLDHRPLYTIDTTYDVLTVHDVLHNHWNTQNINSYHLQRCLTNATTVERVPNRFENGTSLNATTTYSKQNTRFVTQSILTKRVVPTLTIYYMINLISLTKATNMRFFALLLDHREKTFVPHNRYYTRSSSSSTTIPMNTDLYDITHLLSLHQKVTLLRKVIQEGFDMWSELLNHVVSFEYIPFSLETLRSNYGHKILVVSMHNEQHTDEHTGANDSFLKDTLAHAGVNTLHFNLDQGKFFVAPHAQRKNLEIIHIYANDQNSYEEVLNLTVSKSIAREAMIKLYEEQQRQRQRQYQQQQQQHQQQQLPQHLRHRGQFVQIQQNPADSLNLSTRQFDELIHKATLDTIYGQIPNGDCFYCVVLHEISHVLGMGHSNLEFSLLYPLLDRYNLHLLNSDVSVMNRFYHGLHLAQTSHEQYTYAKLCNPLPNEDITFP